MRIGSPYLMVPSSLVMMIVASPGSAPFGMVTVILPVSGSTSTFALEIGLLLLSVTMPVNPGLGLVTV